jgi:NADH-quinone oxidoreductase subunit G
MVNTLSAKRPDLPEAVQTISRSPELQAAARAFAEAENGVILFGSEGSGWEASQALAQACANLLVTTGHTSRPNNGLMAAWQRANDQGAWDMGFRPEPDLKAAMQAAKALYVLAADPAGDDASLAEAAGFLVVQDLFLTKTAKLADVVLPVRAFSEREGSYTSGERRVQRFYPAIPEPAGSYADFAVTGQIGRLLALDMEDRSPSGVMERIASQVPDYAGLTYTKLAEVLPQWPIVGRGDMYYGGTTYENSQGLGVQLASAAGRGAPVSLGWVQPPEWDFPEDSLVAVPITRLYDRGQTLLPSTLIQERIPGPFVVLGAAQAERLKIVDGGAVQVSLNGTDVLVTARVDEALPERFVLVPRSYGIPITGPTTVEIRAAEPVVAS